MEQWGEAGARGCLKRAKTVPESSSVISGSNHSLPVRDQVRKAPFDYLATAGAGSTHAEMYLQYFI